MAVDLPYAKVADALAAEHDVDDASRTALRGRMQHFQRLGFPRGINTGRGRSAKYGFGQVLMLALAFELIQFGLSPEKAVTLLTQNEDAIRKAVGISIAESAEWYEEGEFWLSFSPEVMTTAFRKKGAKLSQEERSFSSGDTGEIATLIFSMQKGMQSRLALIYLSGVMRSIARHWMEQTGTDPETMVSIIKAWAHDSNS